MKERISSAAASLRAFVPSCLRASVPPVSASISFSTASSTPLTNAGLCSVENSLASSMASSMTTFGGVSALVSSQTARRMRLRSTPGWRRGGHCGARRSTRASMHSALLPGAGGHGQGRLAEHRRRRRRASTAPPAPCPARRWNPRETASASPTRASSASSTSSVKYTAISRRWRRREGLARVNLRRRPYLPFALCQRASLPRSSNNRRKPCFGRSVIVASSFGGLGSGISTRPALGERRQRQHGFGPCERLADAAGALRRRRGNMPSADDSDRA